MRFPYKTLPHTKPRPYLNLVLRHGCHTSNILMALVDSGADYPIFPMETATDYLKLDLSDAEVWNFSGTTGKRQTAKLASVSMALLEPNGGAHFCEVPTTCAFCETFAFAGGALLGQNGFFSLFKATFYQPEQYFVLEQWPIRQRERSVSELLDHPLPLSTARAGA